MSVYTSIYTGSQIDARLGYVGQNLKTTALPSFVGLTLSGLTATTVPYLNGSNALTSSAVTPTELGYLSGVTGAIQTQLNAKQATITVGATTILSSNLTASRVLISDGSGKVSASAVTATQIGYLSNVTSDIQTQINNITNIDVFTPRGVIDCSGNPNYPAGNAGDTYRCSVAGKIGGISGKVVEVNDIISCWKDTTVSGNEATVGTYWTVTQTNLDGAIIGPISATDNAICRFDSTTGKLIQNSNITIDDSGVINLSNLTASKMLTLDANKNIVSSYDLNQNLATTSSPAFSTLALGGSSAISNYGISIYRVINDTNDIRGVSITDASNVTSSASINKYGISYNNNASYVTSGQTNSGEWAGISISNYVNSTDHQGTLNKQIGFSSDVGIISCGTGGTVTNSYGFKSYIYCKDVDATILNAYLYHGFYSGSEGTITNKWGLYLSEEAKNQISGHLNIGSGTISNWDSTYKAIEFYGSSIMGHNSSRYISINSNYYFDGTDKYKYTDKAATYICGNGQHIFKVASSGTAGNTITWLDALTVDNSGNSIFGGAITSKTPTGIANVLTLDTTDTIGSGGHAMYLRGCNNGTQMWYLGYSLSVTNDLYLLNGDANGSLILGANYATGLTIDKNGYAYFSSRFACNGAVPQAKQTATDLAGVITALQNIGILN